MVCTEILLEFNNLVKPVADAFASTAIGPDWAYFAIYATVFATILFVASQVINALTGFTDMKRSVLLGTCVISMCHGVSTTGLSFERLKGWFPGSLEEPNTKTDNLILQFSTAYMMVDLFGYLLPYTPTDILFVGHHTIVSSYMLTSFYLGKGAVSSFILMFLGELTSVFQNMWVVSKELRNESKVAAQVYKELSPPYTLYFILVRSVLGPIAQVYILFNLIFLCPTLPLWAKILWGTSSSIGVAGSQLWSYKMYQGYVRNKAKLGRRKHQQADAAPKLE